MTPSTEIHAAGRNPETFNRDRFSRNGNNPDAHASLPFGAGPRQCCGARFALTEAHLALATITSRWHLALDHPINPKSAVELALRIEGGLPIHLNRRHPVTRAKD